MASAVIDQFRAQVEGLLEGGSRYQTEKIGVIVAYVIVVIGTLVWVFGGEDPENPLGAEYGFETIEPLNDRIFFIENSGPRDWTNVRIVLNQNYLHTIPSVPVDERLILRPDDFDYYFHIPREFGRERWEQLSEAKKPGIKAPGDVPTRVVDVRADEGRVTIDVAAEDRAEAAAESAAAAEESAAE